MRARRLLAAFLRICQKTIRIPVAANVEPQANWCWASQPCHQQPLQIRRIQSWGIYCCGQKHGDFLSSASFSLDEYHAFLLTTQITSWLLGWVLLALEWPGNVVIQRAWITESNNQLGWKIPVRSSSPAYAPTPTCQPHHGTECHVRLSSNTSRHRDCTTSLAASSNAPSPSVQNNFYHAH